MCLQVEVSSHFRREEADILPNPFSIIMLCCQISLSHITHTHRDKWRASFLLFTGSLFNTDLLPLGNQQWQILGLVNHLHCHTWDCPVIQDTWDSCQNLQIVLCRPLVTWPLQGAYLLFVFLLLAMLFPDRKWVEHKIDCNYNWLLCKEQFLIFCVLVWMNKNKSISSKHRALHKQFSCVLKHALRYPKFVAVIKNNEQRTKMILEKSRLLIHKLSKWGQKMSISLPSSSDWHALMQFQKCRCHLAPNATKNARNLYWHLKMSTRNFGFYADRISNLSKTVFSFHLNLQLRSSTHGKKCHRENPTKAL